MLEELTKRQYELLDLCHAFQGLRCFDVEIRKTTKNKPFFVRNSIAWDAARSLYRTIVIDLAGWVRSIHSTWLRRNIQGKSLADLRASRKRVAKLLKDYSKQAERMPPEIRGSMRTTASPRRPSLRNHGARQRRSRRGGL